MAGNTLKSQYLIFNNLSLGNLNKVNRVKTPLAINMLQSFPKGKPIKKSPPPNEHITAIGSIFTHDTPIISQDRSSTQTKPFNRTK